MLYNNIDYRRLAQELILSTKAAGSTPTNIYGHGPGGLLSAPGMDQMVFNAMILPHLGLEARLPLLVSNDTDPHYGIITGVTATTGDNPSTECEDFPVAGTAKLCTHSAPFGRIGLNTRVFDIEHAGERTNRGEFMDFSLIGNPLNEGGSLVPTVPGGNSGQWLNNEFLKAMFEFGSSWSMTYAPLLYSANPSNNSGTGYKEFYGLDALINTGYQDAESAQACPAADSIVWAFNNANITSNTADIVGVLQDLFFRLKHIARRSGMGNTKWVICMPYGMFYRLTEVWAYYYITRALTGLTFQTNVNVNVEGDQVTALRDSMRGNLEMRTGQYLIIDGENIEVVLDDGITETEVTPGVFAADIYVVPLTVMGGVRVCYKEAFNFNAPNGSMEMARMMAPGDSYYTTDRGAFMWHKKPPTNWCVEMANLHRPRVVLRTPYLAARITDVAWSPVTQHERSPFTTSGYYVDGGRTSRLGYGPSFYAPTSS